MDRHGAGILGCSLVVVSGVVLVGIGVLRDDTTTIVTGSSVVMMGSAAMTAFSSTIENDE